MPFEKALQRCGRGERQQRQSHGGAVHRHAAGDIGLVDHRAGPRQPLDHQDFVLVQQRQLGVVPHQLVHVLHEGQGGPAKVEGRRTAVGQLPQAHAQADLPIGIAGQ
ncbi:hypothetical protein [Paeniglutamicibacter kerguelensis]|uniref:hypothetical protein n=1 Tax=Paeniglutamicibacter kerguelensis TaxID=254788 RepID=UPI0036237E0A